MLPAISLHQQSELAYAVQDAGKLASLNDGIEAAIAAGKKLKKSQGELRAYQVLYIWNLWYLGRVLEEVAPHGGARLAGTTLQTTLETLGVTKELSAKARKLGEIHEEDVRVFIEESGDVVNVTHLLRLQTESVTEKTWDDDAEWERLRQALYRYADSGEDEYRVEKVSEWIREA